MPNITREGVLTVLLGFGAFAFVWVVTPTTHSSKPVINLKLEFKNERFVNIKIDDNGRVVDIKGGLEGS
jgi:hypothetical protein